MARAWGVDSTTLRRRLYRGIPLDQALTTHGALGTPARDHTGRDFPSVRAMARAWGIDHRLLVSRLEAGWDIERAITAPAGRGGQGTPARDHTGRAFKSLYGMAVAWHVRPATLYDRLNAGWSVERALTAPADVFRGGCPRTCKDHAGQIFPSVKAMCEAWGMSYACYRDRRRNGWTVARALTSPVRPRCSDHTGREFATDMDMCKAWGVPYARYWDRRRRGWAVEDALTVPNVRRTCRARGIAYATYKERRQHGASVEEALEANG